MEIKVGQNICGFKVCNEENVPDAEGVLYTMRHEGCDTPLYYLRRADENKTFSITFKTIPEDDTGVFHIIEHSVLCGSRKYPVKEPFVHLLKSSLQTFLNALTFPDKTMYPVASRNEKDFLNLTDVYLDAVFHPLMLENKNIFLQEGWHCEFSEEGELSFNGVVYNEMKGAFASADDLSMYHINRMLYPKSIYRHESGGEPSKITALSYEQFLKMYRRYYHPSNAEIFLDGEIPLEKTLSLINSYLSEYRRSECSFEIENGTCTAPVSHECEYEISKSESKEDKDRLVLGYVSAPFFEQRRIIAINVLLSALTQSNASPLKEAVLATGLCEDLSVSGMDSVKENSIVFSFRNVKDGGADELYARFVEAVSDIVKAGIDKELLSASVNNLEFQLREKDFGTCPKGIVYAMTLPQTTLYGGKAAESLVFSEHIEALRELIETDYYEQLLSSLILSNKKCARLLMHPSWELGDRTKGEERERAKALLDSLDEEEKGILQREYESLRAFQESEDTEQAIHTLPRLSVADVSEKVQYIPERVTVGVPTVLCYEVSSSGIVYADYYFDVSDISSDSLSHLRLLFVLLTNLKTEKHSAAEVQKLIKSELGSFDFSFTTATRNGEAKLYAVLSASALLLKLESLVMLINEILYTTDFSDFEAIRSHLRQQLLADEDSFVGSGHQMAMTRALSYFSVEGAAKELYSGLSSHEALLKLDLSFEEEKGAFSKELSTLSKSIFTKERLTLSLTCTSISDATRTALCGAIKNGEKCAPVQQIKPLSPENLGIIIPGGVSCAALGARTESLYDLRAYASVAKLIISYEHLWNKVRVQGGAYGAGFVSRAGGNCAFYSFRDPSPAESYKAFCESAAFLRDFVESGADIEGYIIAAVGDSDPILTPRLMGTVAAIRYLSGKSYESACEQRVKMLNTTREKLLLCADAIEKLTEQAKLVIVGNADASGKAGLDRTVEYK